MQLSRLMLMVMVLSRCQKHLPQVDGYCVSNLDEALQLRQAGIDKEILILGVLLPNELELAVANAITVTIASLDWIALARLEKKNVKA